jgi:hypothetical protein
VGACLRLKLDDARRKIRRRQGRGAAVEQLVTTCPGSGGLEQEDRFMFICEAAAYYMADGGNFTDTRSTTAMTISRCADDSFP